jgi:large subunit ribosomal protein L22
MVSKAVLKYIRLSPRKFRLIVPLVKGKRAEEAIAILSSVKKRASLYGIDLLKSAIANAKRKVQGIDTSTLYISKMVADPGPMLKRFRADGQGRLDTQAYQPSYRGTGYHKGKDSGTGCCCGQDRRREGQGKGRKGGCAEKGSQREGSGASQREEAAYT